MPTKAQLQESLEAYKTMYNNELYRNMVLTEQITFLKDLPQHQTLATLSESLAKMGHALRKALEVEKTGRTTGF